MRHYSKRYKKRLTDDFKIAHNDKDNNLDKSTHQFRRMRFKGFNGLYVMQVSV